MISKFSRDVFMTIASSVTSESAFSDSGSFVSARCASLTVDSIGKMMRLSSWNGLLWDIES